MGPKIKEKKVWNMEELVVETGQSIFSTVMHRLINLMGR
jgi:hypothetical protein